MQYSRYLKKKPLYCIPSDVIDIKIVSKNIARKISIELCLTYTI